MAKAKQDRLVKYLIRQHRDGEFVIEIPESWKVTFASVNPASTMSRTEGHCVRIYEMPGSKLRAVFDSVLAIRDLSIPLARKVKSEVGSATWSRDSEGNFSESRDIKIDTTLILDPGDDF